MPDNPALAAQTSLPHHKRIEDGAFRKAVELLADGNMEALRAHLSDNPELVHRHVTFEGGNYFRNPTLLVS